MYIMKFVEKVSYDNNWNANRVEHKYVITLGLHYI